MFPRDTEGADGNRGLSFIRLSDESLFAFFKVKKNRWIYHKELRGALPANAAARSHTWYATATAAPACF